MTSVNENLANEQQINVDVEPMEEHVEEHVEEPVEENVNGPVEKNVYEFSQNGNDNNDGIEHVPLNIYDPRNWDNLDSKWRDLLVKNGPIRDLLTGKGPKDKLNRRFSSKFYNRYLSNGEKHHRDWLVYSKVIDRVFCFCCKLFKKRPQPSQLADEGSSDWRYLSNNLKMHERSAEHINHMTIWVDLLARLKSKQTIDKVVQDRISKETEHWGKVLRRLFAIVKYLAKQSLAFHGTNEKMYEQSNGNFMALVEWLQSGIQP